MAIGTPVNLLATDPAGASDATTSTTVVGTVANASSANSIVVAIASMRTGNVVTACTISDSNTLTWTTISGSFVSGNGAAVIAWALDTTGIASGTVTATFDVTGTRKGLSVHSITGLDTSSPVDTAVTANASGSTGTPAVTAAAASSQANTIFIAGFRHNTSTADSATPSTGFTEHGDFSVGATNFLDHYAEYKISSATETPTATMTPGITTTTWGGVIVGLKAPAATSVAPPAATASSSAPIGAVTLSGSNWIVAGITMPP